MKLFNHYRSFIIVAGMLLNMSLITESQVKTSDESAQIKSQNIPSPLPGVTGPYGLTGPTGSTTFLFSHGMWGNKKMLNGTHRTQKAPGR